MNISQIQGKQLIGYQEQAEGNEYFHSVDPASGALSSIRFYKATTAEVSQAASLAESAFAIYRKTSGQDKSAFLLKIAEELVNNKAELVEVCMKETALPQARLDGEVGRTVNQLKLFSELLAEGSWVDARIDTAMPDRSPLPKPDLRSMLIPLGPVAIFGASNFPFAFSVAGGDTVSALASGCPVIFKAHPAHPITSELVGKAILRAAAACGLPEGVFSMLHGDGPSTGTALVTHPSIKAVGFTGSYKAGKSIAEAAFNRPQPIPVYAEVGSSNPVFVLPGALKQHTDKIAAGYVQSLTMGAGQFCTNPGLLVYQEDSSPESNIFLSALKDGISKATTHSLLTEAIGMAFSKGVVERSAHPALAVLASSTAAEKQPVPTLFSADHTAFSEDPSLEEELFGPAGIIVNTPSKEDLLQLARKLSGHLTATIHATEEDLRDYKDLFDILEQKVGRILINGFPTGVEVSHAMVHGGPYPATSDSRTTSVGTAAIFRFTRPVCYQSFAGFLLPDELKDENPLGIWRLVNGKRTNEII
ncbi:NADP-dependent aldehyde dehydrogenase [Arcticibacter pallidicorallinus]|uniref:NADP-dependent aldehyde dehydrogenase n=1 Tax=Arcticibacter pallidicorallinus TaxID=1259464 RepID=A0A2T0UC91_9SPHI|nr:aldehyde dehydrogenase (NADP(+)) [Arcticibacter pallidicorallinus]PRY55555.1 NADP-dependent aldehyde dehydrogenase [Arcticibacter pallidicorallinus]